MTTICTTRTTKLIGFFFFLIFSCSEKPKEKTEVALNILNDLPSMEISLLKGESIQAKNLKGKVVLILFQPDCDHCQHEAREIEEQLPLFKNCTLYFVASSPVAEVEKFAADYNLTNNSKVLFGITTTESILNNFGPIQAPSIYIYSEGRLIKSFNGQTTVNEILKFI